MHRGGANVGANRKNADETNMRNNNSESIMAFTAAQVAEKLNFSLRTIRTITAEGLLPYRQLGRSVRYTEADINSYLDAHRIGGYV